MVETAMKKKLAPLDDDTGEGYFDPATETYVIPKGTVVMVADKAMKLKQHTTKRENEFARELIMVNSGPQPRMTLTTKLCRSAPVSVTPSEMLDVGYYTFDTKYPSFPYMIVAMSLFQISPAKRRELEANRRQKPPPPPPPPPPPKR